jgi:hypothetical protein
MYLAAWFSDKGVPKTGLTPTIDVWELVSGTQVVTAQSMTEVAGGWYRYNFAGYSDTTEYVIRCDGGAGLKDFERYKYGQNEVPLHADRIEDNIRGADDDDLKDISDQIDGISASAIATAVWSEALPGAYGAGEAGKIIGDNIDALISSRSSHTAADVDTQLSGTHGAGSWEGDTAAVVAAAVWSESLPGAYGVGEAGYILGTYLDALISSRAAPGDAMDLIANAVDATAIATGAIDADAIAASAITAAKIADNTITNAKIATGAISATKIADNALENSKFATGALSSTKLAAGTITAASIATDAITAAKIAANALTSAKIATDAIGSAQLATSAVNEIVDQVWNELIAEHIAAGSTGEALNEAASGAGVDWTVNERQQIRDALGIDGTKVPATDGQLQNIPASTWSVAIPGGYGAGSAGYILGTYLDMVLSNVPADTKDEVWGESLPGAWGAGTAGFIIGHYLDAAVSGVAESVWDVAVEDHLDPGSFGLWLLEVRYMDGVYADDDQGSPGTATGQGTRRTPISGLNLADVKTVAEARGVRKIIFVDNSMYTPTQSFLGDWFFVGEGVPVLNLDSAYSFTDCQFIRCYIIGDGADIAGAFESVCGYGTFEGVYFRCLIVDNFTFGSGSNLIDCSFACPNFFPDGTSSIRRGCGEIVVKDMTYGTLYMQGFQGDVTIDSSCTGGVIELSGHGHLVNNTGGTTVNKEGWVERSLIADDVWDEYEADHEIAETMGELLHTAAMAGGAADWTSAERSQIRDALGIDGAKVAAVGGQLQDIPTDVGSLLSGAHGSGSWEGDSAATIDALLSTNHGAGSWEGDSAATIEALLSTNHGAGSWEGASTSDVASAVWDALAVDHNLSDTMGRIMNALYEWVHPAHAGPFHPSDLYP